MPYSIDTSNAGCDKGYAVVKDSDKKVVGCHSSRRDARAQIAALNASEKLGSGSYRDEPQDVEQRQPSEPAPKEDQIEGSKVNKPGSAAGSGAGITLNEQTETALQNKSNDHNEAMSTANRPAHTRVTVGKLRSVYRRGSGAFSVSHRPGISRAAWSMARVNAFLFLARTGRPQNPRYVGDNDLLHPDHPRAVKKDSRNEQPSASIIDTTAPSAPRSAHPAKAAPATKSSEHPESKPQLLHKDTHTMNSFLTSLHEKRNQKAELIDGTLNRAAEEDRDISEVETANVAALAKEIEKLDERIAQVTDIEVRKDAAAVMAQKVEGNSNETRQASPARITSEERTYSPTSEHSFIRDAYAAQVNGDYEARERIQRHQHEERIEKRDVTSAAFAGLIVPQFLTDLAAPFARAGRPFLDVSRKHALPAAGLVISISKVTTGSATAVQSEGAAVQETNMDDTKLDVSIITVAGQQNVSRQAIERGTGIDSLVMADLVSAYHTNLDLIAVNTGANSVTATTTQVVTYTDASPTVAELYPKILDAVQQIQTNYFAGPNFIAMHPRRLAFILAATDTTGRPLAVPTTNGPNNALAVGAGSVVYGNSGYSIAGLPVITDANITTTNGDGENEDLIIIGNSQESHCFEQGNGAPFSLRFEDVKSAELEVKMVVYGYSAYTANRYDKAFALIGGTGLVTPSF